MCTFEIEKLAFINMKKKIIIILHLIVLSSIDKNDFFCNYILK